MEIGTTDTSELHSVKALLDCGATRSLIDRDFVHLKEMNTQTLSHNIPVFNVDGSPNEAGQISEVVDIEDGNVMREGLGVHPLQMDKISVDEAFGCSAV